MQNSEISLAFKPNVLNMMSIFLAVSVLVYSVVIGTAKYEVRAEGLTQCGNKLKELNRELNRLITDSQNNDEENKKLLEEFEKRYSAIVTDTENHSRTDYLSAMLEMKSDMGGSATVIAAMALIAKNKLKVNVTAVIAACENMIDGNAYKPGDIIGTMDGAFIEVDNTDAEGRLTLADAVTYSIEEEKVSQIIELSTLTGAVIVALGDDITGVITKYDDIYKDLKKASKDTLDEIWQLPYHEEYMSLLKSDVADMKNSGGRAGGSITAGLFVTKFAKDTPIAHLDIAGSAWSENGDVLHTKGGTGNSVLMLYKYFENISK